MLRLFGLLVSFNTLGSATWQSLHLIRVKGSRDSILIPFHPSGFLAWLTFQLTKIASVGIRNQIFKIASVSTRLSHLSEVRLIPNMSSSEVTTSDAFTRYFDGSPTISLNIIMFLALTRLVARVPFTIF